VALYRCDFLDRKGKIFGSHEIEARSDDEAMAQARALCRRSAVLLWCGERRVGATGAEAAAARE